MCGEHGGCNNVEFLFRYRITALAAPWRCFKEMLEIIVGKGGLNKYQYG